LANEEQLKINYSIPPNRKHQLLRIQIDICHGFCTLIC